MFPEWLLGSFGQASMPGSRLIGRRTVWAWRVRSRIVSGLAERKGWRVAGLYVDDDVSAWSGKRRPEYARMLADLRGGHDQRPVGL